MEEVNGEKGMTNKERWGFALFFVGVDAVSLLLSGDPGVTWGEWSIFFLILVWVVPTKEE